MRLCLHGYSYELMNSDSILVYHLSHSADKSKYLEINKEKYRAKQKAIGKRFCVNHFFGIYDDESFNLFKDY